MGKTLIFLSFVATLIVSGIGWSRLSVESYTGDVGEKSDVHPCPTLHVRFEQESIPMAVRDCGCRVQASDVDREIAVHPPEELVQAASPGDRLGFSLHEYPPVFGGKVKRALKWVLAGGTVGKRTFVVSPASSVYWSIILTGLAPFLLGTALAVAMGLLLRRKAPVGA